MRTDVISSFVGGVTSNANTTATPEDATDAAVDLRRVYTMPGRGSNNNNSKSNKSNNLVDTDEDDDKMVAGASGGTAAAAGPSGGAGGPPSPTSVTTRNNKGKVKLRHSKSDGDYSLKNNSTAVAVVASPSSSCYSGASSSASSTRTPSPNSNAGAPGGGVLAAATPLAASSSKKKQYPPQQQQKHLEGTTAAAINSSSDKDARNQNHQRKNSNTIMRQHYGDGTTSRHKVDKFGFIKNMDSTGNIRRGERSGEENSGDGGDDDSSAAEPTSSQAQLAERRVKKWQSMLIRGDATSSSFRKNRNDGNRNRTGVRRFLGLVPIPPFSSLSVAGTPSPPVSSLSAGAAPTKFYAQSGPNAPKHLHRQDHATSNQKPSPGTLFKPRSKKLVRRARKGIPDELRGRVWAHLLGDVGYRIDQYEGMYDRLVRETIVEDDYCSSDDDDGAMAKENVTKLRNGGIGGGATQEQNNSNNNNEDDAIRLTKSFRNLQDTIERDIHRTFPRHALFYSKIDEEREEDFTNQASNPSGLCGSADIARMILDLDNKVAESGEDDVVNAVKSHCILDAKGGQASLRRVLKAYSLYDREIGYCQGMNFIAGMFLTQMSEEEAFWLLVTVMFEEPCRMRGLFGEGMRETHQVLHVAEKLIHQFLPKLANHLDREHVHITMFATQWLLTQYTSSFKFDLVLRVWDCFLTEGWKITYRVMLALLMEYQSDILKMQFEEILAFFRELPNRVDGGSIVDSANKIPLRRKHITKYEKEWNSSQPQQH